MGVLVCSCACLEYMHIHDFTVSLAIKLVNLHKVLTWWFMKGTVILTIMNISG